MKTYKKGRKKFAHWKLDGHSLRIVKDQYGMVRCFTSHPHDITEKLKHRIISAGMYTSMPNGTVLLGELWTPDGQASDVKTAINDPSWKLYFSCFAVETLPHDMGLQTLDSQLQLWGVRSVPHYNIDLICDGDPEYFMNQPLPVYLGKEVEGYVFKDGQLLNCEKWKPVKTIDLVVTGYKDGNGKYLGLIGAIEASTIEGHVVASVGGMDDSTRIDLSDREDEFLGTVVEVAYQYVGAGGRLRHPRFVRWRDDKKADECTTSQDPDLEKHYADRKENS
jgi:hypothetical protein